MIKEKQNLIKTTLQERSENPPDFNLTIVKEILFRYPWFK